MWRRFAVSLMGAGAMILLLGSLSGEAVAQHRYPVYASHAMQPAGPSDVAALFRRPAVPVRLFGLEGPRTIRVGEEASFTAAVNVAAASMPVHFRWDFGDGSTHSSLHARHEFGEPGTYTVAFTVWNKHGEATETLEVHVVEADVVEPDAG